MTFEDFVRSHGLIPGHIVADGKVHACPTTSHPRKKNGRYCLAVDQRVGWVQDWSVHSDFVKWRATRNTTGEEVDWEEIRRQKAEAAEERGQASEEAKKFWQSCDPVRDSHPYLKKKGLGLLGAPDLRVDRRGWLVVPARINGKLVSVQRIAPDGTKKFWPGARIQGASFEVQRPGAAITVLCEGLATGLTLLSSAPTIRIVVAFFAGNMPRVAATMRRYGLVCVAADNDHETLTRTGSNPGVLAAREAARILGCGVLTPEGIHGTDWNDYVSERAAERPRGERDTDESIRRDVLGEVYMEIGKAARLAQNR